MNQVDIHVVAFEGPLEEAVSGLQARFGLDPASALQFASSVPRLARSAVNEPEARAYQEALLALGAVVELRPSEQALPALRDGTVTSPPDYDSSAELAGRIPKAPGIPVEALALEQARTAQHAERLRARQRGAAVGLMLLVVGALGGLYYRLQNPAPQTPAPDAHPG